MEIVGFFILTFCLAKSLEHIDNIVLDCQIILYTDLETWLNKIWTCVTLGVVVDVATSSIFGN